MYAHLSACAKKCKIIVIFGNAFLGPITSEVGGVFWI